MERGLGAASCRVVDVAPLPGAAPPIFGVAHGAVSCCRCLIFRSQLGLPADSDGHDARCAPHVRRSRPGAGRLWESRPTAQEDGLACRGRVIGARKDRRRARNTSRGMTPREGYCCWTSTRV